MDLEFIRENNGAFQKKPDGIFNVTIVNYSSP